MRKKGMLTLASVLTLSSFLAACGSNEEAAGGNESAEDGTVTLNFWGGVPPENGPQEVVDQWNEENPDVQVTYTRYVNDDSGNLSVNTALQTEEDIDILMSHSANDYYQRVDSGFLTDLSEHVTQDFVDNTIGPGTEKWEVDGTYYALPTNMNAIFIMLNEAIFEENGIEIPENVTWDQLHEFAVQLQSENVEYAYARDADTIAGIIQNAVIDEGLVKEDGTSNLDHPNIKKGLELYYQMMHEEQVMPVFSEQVATNMAPEQMFLEGDIAMYQAGAWRLRMSNDLEEYPRDFNIAFVPYPNFEGQSTPAHHIEDAMSIVQYTEHPEEAWEFIDWYSTEGMLALSPGGRVPARNDAPQDEAREMIIQGAEDTYNVETLNATYEAENTSMLPELPYQVADQVNAELESYFLGNQDIDQTIENMVTFHNDYLQRQ